MAMQPIIMEEEDSENEEEKVLNEVEEVMEQCFPKRNSLVLRRALKVRKEVEEDSSQRATMFFTKCKVKGEICDLIIGGNNEANMVVSDVVKRLSLKMTRHLAPYRITLSLAHLCQNL